MGCGNVCVTGAYEGLFYIDNDDLHVYRRYNEEDDCYETAMCGDLGYDDLSGGGWEYDEVESDWIWKTTLEHLVEGMKLRFKSLNDCDFWTRRDEHAVLENQLFYIVVQDNQWSVAVKLIQKDDWCIDLSGLQKKHYLNYLQGICETLFERFDSLGTYGGAWTSGRIYKGDPYEGF